MEPESSGCRFIDLHIFRDAVLYIELRRIRIALHAVSISQPFHEETGTDDFFRSVSFFACLNRHILNRASCDIRNRDAGFLFFITSCISCQTADPIAVVTGIDCDVFRNAVRELLSTKSASRDSSETIAFLPVIRQ